MYVPVPTGARLLDREHPPHLERRQLPMPDSNKILFLHHTDPTADPSAGASVAEQEAAPCSCCEASLSELIAIIRDCGQDPVTQLSGYLITEDPTYLPDGTNARAIARRVGRDKLLTTLLELYIRSCPTSAPSFES